MTSPYQGDSRSFNVHASRVLANAVCTRIGRNLGFTDWAGEFGLQTCFKTLGSGVQAEHSAKLLVVASS